jgi:LuxR family quorum-sensing system transcriptional regulator CciR
MAGRFSELQAFVDAAGQAFELSQMGSLLDAFVREQGFDYYALVDHVASSRRELAAVGLSNYPTSWSEMIGARGYFQHDPVNAACQKTSVGFAWSEVPKLIDLTEKQKEILAASAREGMGEGFTVPIHVPGEFSASSSFGLRFGRAFPKDAAPIMQYAGCFAFETARRLARRAQRRKALEKPPELTTRQFDCIVLAAQGKSDWEASKILGISAHTVHQHIETAKRRYEVGTRMQLIVKALYSTQLTFRDII